MQRGKRLRGLFISGDAISIRRICQAPPVFPALAHKPFVRTGVDLPRGICVYEEESQPLRNLAATYRDRVAANGYSLDQMTAHLQMALQERREWLTQKP